MSDLKRKLIDLGTGSKVRDLLISKLRAVLDGENPDRVPEDPELAEICSHQALIGWDQLMRGRFAKQWARHANTQLGTRLKRKHSWTTEVIDFIFTQWWHLWELRNQDRHGRDLESRLQAEARQVERELTMFYDNYEDLHHST